SNYSLAGNSALASRSGASPEPGRGGCQASGFCRGCWQWPDGRSQSSPIDLWFFWKTLARNQFFLRKQSGLHGKTHQARNIMKVQGVHQLHTMVLDGFGADLQDLGNLFGVLAFGDELEDF